MSAQPDLKTEKLVAESGQYSAIMNNGDIVLAKFSTCGLGASSHYFSIKKLSDAELMEKLKLLLKNSLASEPLINKVMPQLSSLNAADFAQPIVLEGLGDQHEISIKPSFSSIYQQHIQYVWIPPEF